MWNRDPQQNQQSVGMGNKEAAGVAACIGILFTSGGKIQNTVATRLVRNIPGDFTDLSPRLLQL